MENSILYFYGDDIDQHLDESGHAVLNYWNELRQGQPFPDKSSFDPTRVPRALPGIQIVELVEKPVEFKYRLIGTREVDARGWDPTGKPVVEGFVGPSAEKVLEHYYRTIEAEAPLGVAGIFRKYNGVWIEDFSLFLPMAGKTGDLQYIFVYSYQRPALNKDGRQL